MNLSRITLRGLSLSSAPKVRFKIVLIGDGMVGKTTIAKRYLGKGFEQEYIRTLGVDFYKKITKIKHPRLGDVMIEWYIWDLGGQYYWSDVRPMYYTGAKGGILVYDVARPETFANVKYWLAEFIKNVGHVAPLVLVGNKIDLRGKVPNTVPKEKGEELAKIISEKMGIEVPYFEASAKEGININEIFNYLAVNIIDFLLKKRLQARK